MSRAASQKNQAWPIDKAGMHCYNNASVQFELRHTFALKEVMVWQDPGGQPQPQGEARTVATMTVKHFAVR